MSKLEIGFNKINKVFIPTILKIFKDIRKLTYIDSNRNDLKLDTLKYPHQVASVNVKVLCHGHCRCQTSTSYQNFTA